MSFKEIFIDKSYHINLMNHDSFQLGLKRNARKHLKDVRNRTEIGFLGRHSPPSCRVCEGGAHLPGKFVDERPAKLHRGGVWGAMPSRK